jgi:hypothetical protein
MSVAQAGSFVELIPIGASNPRALAFALEGIDLT